jgi:hypothetical protein
MAAVTVASDSNAVPIDRHHSCWYGRRSAHLPAALTVQTIEDGEVLYCAHPMLLPIVGYDFDIRNCQECDAFRPRPQSRTPRP